MPTLSIDSIRSKYCFKVSKKDRDEFHKLENEWSQTVDLLSSQGTQGESQLWSKLVEYKRILKKKYLPKTLDCLMMDFLVVDNIPEFKRGLIDCLWDCDMCEYSLKEEDIKIYDGKFSTHIEFTLDEE